MNTESRELYEKLKSGQTEDIEPGSRIEAYLMAMVENGVGGGSGGGACNVPKPTADDNGKVLQVVNGKAEYVSINEMLGVIENGSY